jgi:ParB-like nuclease domain
MKPRQAKKSESLQDQGEEVAIEIKCAFSEMVKITELNPHPKNPREHSKRQIKTLSEAIKRNGFRRAIIVSSLSKVIIAGHGTCEAAKLLRMESVPVDYQHFETTADEAAFLVSDNHIARMGTTDSKMVAEIMQDFGSIDLESFGFSESERLTFFDHEKESAIDQSGEDKTKEKQKTTKNGLAVAEKDETEQPVLIVATISKEAARSFAAWKKENTVDDDNEALTIILKNL